MQPHYSAFPRRYEGYFRSQPDWCLHDFGFAKLRCRSEYQHLIARCTWRVWSSSTLDDGGVRGLGDDGERLLFLFLFLFFSWWKKKKKQHMKKATLFFFYAWTFSMSLINVQSWTGMDLCSFSELGVDFFLLLGPLKDKEVKKTK